jgi:hypothetical protein
MITVQMMLYARYLSFPGLFNPASLDAVTQGCFIYTLAASFSYP